MPRGTTQVVTRGASNDWCQMCRYEVRGGRASVRGTVAVRGVSTRQYEARRALRALKGQVKFQALVRKQVAATLYSMQALLRAQLAVRSKRVELAVRYELSVQPETRHEKSTRFDNGTRREIHNKRLSTSYDSTTNSYDESPKIVGMDSYRPHGRSRRNHYQDPESGFIGKDYKCSKTTQSTLHFSNSNRTALRALKGLVKFQALFRGFLVRKRVVATLYSMQDLLRAQLAVRSKRAELAVRYQLDVQPQIRHGESNDRFDNDTRREIHNKRLLTSYDSTTNSYDESPKIVGMDPYRPHGRSRRNHYQDPESGFSGKDYKCSKTTQTMAGAQAAVAVVSLTSDGRDIVFSGREKWAATEILRVYRGHL
ncbi:IQ-DOMAIN 14-like protein, partial [Tanacetum coccineum]